jgi:pterin-4a-carbinolamine dehydratase
MPEMINHLPAWVLEEPVDVTLVYHNADTVKSIYLCEHVSSIDCEDDGDHGRSAITIEFNDTGRILLNGVDVDLGDDMMAVCSLIDDVGGIANAQHFPDVGVTYQSVPFKE